MNGKTVLISGAGISGPTLAFWLHAAGFKPTLIEHAPALRSTGFLAAFAPKTRWGLFLRNQAIKALAIPGPAQLAFGRDIIDTLQLPDYRWPFPAQIGS
jgi:2-polyprenyl-6-methoxyphenol hydroxylase-like FAD-dependent oxidoreductase